MYSLINWLEKALDTRVTVLLGPVSKASHITPKTRIIKSIIYSANRDLKSRIANKGKNGPINTCRSRGAAGGSQRRLSYANGAESCTAEAGVTAAPCLLLLLLCLLLLLLDLDGDITSSLCFGSR